MNYSHSISHIVVGICESSRNLNKTEPLTSGFFHTLPTVIERQRTHTFARHGFRTPSTSIRGYARRVDGRSVSNVSVCLPPLSITFGRGPALHHPWLGAQRRNELIVAFAVNTAGNILAGSPRPLPLPGRRVGHTYYASGDT